MPLATAAAEPLDEPPGVLLIFHGLAVLPGALCANSVQIVFPSGIAFAERNPPTQDASRDG